MMCQKETLAGKRCKGKAIYRYKGLTGELVLCQRHVKYFKSTSLTKLKTRKAKKP